MKKLTAGIILLSALLVGLSQAQQKSANIMAVKCWYNPDIENCDTGGTVACIDEACDIVQD